MRFKKKVGARLVKYLGMSSKDFFKVFKLGSDMNKYVLEEIQMETK